MHRGTIQRLPLPPITIKEPALVQTNHFSTSLQMAKMVCCPSPVMSQPPTVMQLRGGNQTSKN